MKSLFVVAVSQQSCLVSKQKEPQKLISDNSESRAEATKGKIGVTYCVLSIHNRYTFLRIKVLYAKNKRVWPVYKSCYWNGREVYRRLVPSEKKKKSHCPDIEELGCQLTSSFITQAISRERTLRVLVVAAQCGFLTTVPKIDYIADLNF